MEPVDRPMQVTTHYVVVDGLAGEALQAGQDAAIQAAAEWLLAHPPEQEGCPPGEGA